MMADGRRHAGGASCEERERNGALAGIGACLVLAITIALVATLMGGPEATSAAPTLAMRKPDPVAGGRGGAADRSGSAASGAGPGAGSDGERTGLRGDKVDDAAKGAQVAQPGEADAGPGTDAESVDSRSRKLGFSVRNEDPPEPEPGIALGRPDGTDGTGARGGGAGLLGIETDAKSVVYVLDHSASMRDRREQVLDAEMNSSIASLPKDGRFAIVLFGRSPAAGATWVDLPGGGQRCRTRIAMPPGQLVDATRENRARATRWLADQEPDPAGESIPWDAMEFALSLNPEAIFLLTDGEFQPQHTADLEEAIRAAGARAKIHTVAFGSDGDIDSLQRIADKSGGTYRRIPLPADP